MTSLIGASAPSFARAQEPSAITPPLSTSPTLEQRVDETDQRARIALRKLELLEEAAAERDKQRAVIQIGQGGLVVSSADGAYSVGLHGVLQVDGRIFVNDYHKLTDTLLIRRARPILDATLGRNFSFRIMPDFGGGTTVLYDAYAEARAADEFAVTAGKFKPDVGLERIQVEPATYFVERGMPTSLVPARDVGVAVHGEFFGGKLGYSVGFFNGVVDGGAGGDVDFDDSKEFQARLYTRPFAVPKGSPPAFLSGFLV
ncbi:MAG TPA: porin, partial [Polyangiaceae bacterium]|nr:porin [Polyangiaceae bacterium]